MVLADAVPIIIGVGDVKNTPRSPEDAIEPLDLMLNAIQNAATDTRLPASQLEGFLASAESIDVVQQWTWPYKNLPRLIASHIKAKPTYTTYTEVGGHQPCKLLDEAARRIASRHTKLAVLTGGEALASLTVHMAIEKVPPSRWTKPDQDVQKVFAPSGSALPPGLGADHNIGLPIQVYPLYENGLRQHRGQSLHANNSESARLYAEFAKVAEKNAIAWSHGKKALSEEEIGTIGKKNRMVCFPYPLLMNAFNTVDLAAACILTSTEHARVLGVPEDRWIYILGAAGTSQSANIESRPNYYSSASLSQSIDAALRSSGLKKEEVDIFDIYSCFPIVPKLAAEHLHLPIVESPKPLTVLGGLTSFGGAGNNYSMHAITEMTRQLRRSKMCHGMVLANGGVLTYHHAVCLSNHPPLPGNSYPKENPLPSFIDTITLAPVDRAPNGEAIMETYTVDFDRKNQPILGHIVGRMKETNHRFLANHGDEYTLNELASWNKEPIGRSGIVSSTDSKRNLFTFDQRASL